MELTIEFEAFTCDCGMSYALPKSYVKARRRDHKNWTCPGCRSYRHFPGKSDLERERESREYWEQRARSCTARAEHAAHRANGFKGAMRKAQRQVANLREVVSD